MQYLRADREQKRLRQYGKAPADGPAGLDRSNRPAAILRANDFAHQDGACRPFAAETEAEQGARHQKLIEVLYKGTDQREEREPDDGDLQRLDASDAVAQIAGKPAADGRGEQRDSACKTGRAGSTFHIVMMVPITSG
jgi:hypothetical protein